MSAVGKDPMPAGELVELVCGDGSSDYMDGDHPGYATGTWNYATGELVLAYDPDVSEDLEEEYRSPYGPTVRRFREVSTAAADVPAAD